MKKIFIAAGFVVTMLSLVSCEKSYTCKCYTYKRNHPTYNKPVGTYELLEKDRKTATYICKTRNSTNQVTNQVIDCKLTQ